MCSCPGSRAIWRRGNWPQEWMLGCIASSSLQDPAPHPPAAGDVACRWLTGESLLSNHPPLGGATPPKVQPRQGASCGSMPGGYRNTKAWPLCLSLGHFWRAIPDSELCTELADMSMQTLSLFNFILFQSYFPHSLTGVVSKNALTGK